MMTSSRRDCLAQTQHTDSTHAGLWLDKYLPDHEKGTGQAFVEDVSKLTVEEIPKSAIPTPYTEFFKRWQETLKLAGVKGANMRKAHVLGRLAVGLGGEAVLETAITLHRTYGLPYIPGSALKGLASSYAHKRLEDETWRKGDEAHNIMFGTTKEAGYVTFFDALYVPGSGFLNERRKPQALWPDVITVHHPKYYQGDEPPADWDNPTPIPFLTATGDYLIALQGDEAWVKMAFEILNHALAEEGVGAKTSSGYGRMRIKGMAVKPQPPNSDESPSQPEPEIVTRRGVVVKIHSSRGGTVGDAVTGDVFRFPISVISGNFPGRGSNVIFKLQGDEVVHLKRA